MVPLRTGREQVLCFFLPRLVGRGAGSAGSRRRELVSGLATSMAFILGLALAVGLYLWNRAREQKRLERYDLAHPTYDEHDDDLHWSWQLNFDEMTARYSFSSMDAKSSDDLALRRVGISQWEVKPTHASWQRECTELEATKTTVLGRARYQERLEELQKGPLWKPLPDTTAAKAENDYQKYLAVQGRS
jgi:hypothetical protein